MKFNIVILDDNFVIRQVLSILFKRLAKIHKLDLNIYTSANGLEGLGYVYLSNPNVILIDTTLPKYSGKELFDFLLSNEKFLNKKIFVGILDQGDKNVDLPVNFSVISKTHNNFVSFLFDSITESFGGKYKLDHLSLLDKFLVFSGNKAASWANNSDLTITRIDHAKPWNKIWLYPYWILSQILTSLYLTGIYLFARRPHDENIDQVKQDRTNYRVRYYPTLALTITTLFALFIQIVTFAAGSISLLNIRIENIFATGDKIVELDLADTTHDSEKISYENNILQLKSQPIQDEAEPELPVTVTPTLEATPAEEIEPIATIEVSPSPAVTEIPESDSESVLGEVLSILVNYPTDKPQIIFNQGIEYSELTTLLEESTINNFETSLETPAEAYFAGDFPKNTITYQLSPDKEHWFFFDGELWQPTEADYLASNTVQQINAGLSDYPSSSHVVYIKAFLHSSGLQQIELKKLAVGINLDLITSVSEPEAIPEPVSVPIHIQTLIDQVKPVILNASWVNGKKVVAGRLEIPEGVAINPADLNDLEIIIYYTDSTNIHREATNVRAELFRAQIFEIEVNGQLEYVFETTFPSEPGGYLTAELAYAPDSEEIIKSDLANPIENSTFTVTETGDQADASAGDGLCDRDLGTPGSQCTLRAAIQEANALAGTDNIHFNISGGGLQTISPATALPTITQALTIDGSTQPEASCNPLSLRVQLYGPNSLNALTVGGPDVTIIGMNINHFANGIHVTSASTNTTVQCNIIGLDYLGDAIVGNTGNAVHFDQNNGALVGGTTPETRNILSGNSRGVYTTSFNTFNITVQGNYIGTDVTGTKQRGNTVFGLELRAGNLQDINTLIGGTTGTTPGGACTGACNIISNSGASGMFITGTPSTGLVIQGNFIGLDVTGTVDFGNGEYGIYANRYLGGLVGGELPGGEPDPNARNVISGNARDGIYYYQRTSTSEIIGNYIGTNSAGTAAIPNSWNGIHFNPTLTEINGNVIKSNLISGNGIHGISFANSGANITLNTIESNIIGRNFDNTQNLPNAFRGINFSGASSNVIQNNYISGNTTEGIYLTGAGTVSNTISGNIISGNGGTAGIFITNNSSLNNIIFNSITSNNKGIVLSNAGNIYNIINSNAISDNVGLGIDLNNDNVTGNDLNDGDNGANGNQNYPVLDYYTYTGDLNAYGTFNSTANSYFRIEFFGNEDADSTGYGEGEYYLGGTIIQTDGSGNYDFSTTPLIVDAPGFVTGHYITATATSCTTSDCSTLRNTSEFSAAASAYVFIVNSAGDSPDLAAGNGACDTGSEVSPGVPECTLRAAIEETNAYPGQDTINFEIATDYQLISVASDLPVITETVIIDGSTQPGATCDPLAPKIELYRDGTRAGNGLQFVDPAHESIVQGLIINNFNQGIVMTGVDDTSLLCNIIGLAADGTTVKGNGPTGGVVITGGSGVTIGGSKAGAGNLISGNTGVGIQIASSQNTIIQGNRIGTDITGTIQRINSTYGIELTNASPLPDVANIMIGGTDSVDFGNSCTGACNLIVGATGIRVRATSGAVSASLAFIQGNYIGTNYLGSSSLSPAGARCIQFDGMGNSQIGGLLTGEGNLISGCGTAGIELTNNSGVIGSASQVTIQGNFIGTNDTGTAAIANGQGIRLNANTSSLMNTTIESNLISGNSTGIQAANRSTATFVYSNKIGTNAEGTGGVPNGTGIHVSGTGVMNFIYIGSGPDEANQIMYNTNRGLYLANTSTPTISNNYISNNNYGIFSEVTTSIIDENTFLNNTIGIYLGFNTNWNVITENLIQDSTQQGIYIATGSNNEIVANDFIDNGIDGILVTGGTNNQIIDNTFSGNARHGVYISFTGNTKVEGNEIFNNSQSGISRTSTSSHFIENNIYNNGGLGIDLGGNGVTANDPGDADSVSFNAYQNYPVLSSAIYQENGDLEIYGSLNSIANTYFRMEFYGSSVSDATGYGEGEMFLGSALIQTDSNGNYSFSTTPILITPPDEYDYITATATKCTSIFETTCVLPVLTSEFSNVVKPLTLELVYPINNTVLNSTVNIFYDWNLLGETENYPSNIAYYEIYRDGKLVLTTSNANTNAIEDDASLPDGTYAWYVQGYTAEGTLVATSNEGNFVISLPVIPSPTPTMTPTPDIGEPSPTPTMTPTAGPSPTLVPTVIGGGTPTTYTFEPLYPVDVIIDEFTPRFDWSDINPASRADTYDLYVNNQKIASTDINDSFYQMTRENSLLRSGSHTWYVVALNNGQEITRTRVAQFQLRVPFLPDTGGIDTDGDPEVPQGTFDEQAVAVVATTMLVPVAIATAAALFVYPNSVLYALAWLKGSRKGIKWGTIYDSETKKAIGFTRLLIFKQNKLIHKTVSDPQGNYYAPYNEGVYWVTAQHGAYEPAGIEVHIEQGVKEMKGDIYLMPLYNEFKLSHYTMRYLQFKLSQRLLLINSIIFVIGFVYSAIVTIVYPNWFNFGVVAIYLIQIILFTNLLVALRIKIHDQLVKVFKTLKRPPKNMKPSRHKKA